MYYKKKKEKRKEVFEEKFGTLGGNDVIEKLLMALASDFFAQTCTLSLGAHLCQVSRRKHKKWGSYGGAESTTPGSEEPLKGPVLIWLRNTLFSKTREREILTKALIIK